MLSSIIYTIFGIKLYQLVARQVLAAGLKGLFKPIRVRFKMWKNVKILSNILEETSLEIQKHYPYENIKIGTPFYQSKETLIALLKLHFFNISNFKQISINLSKEKGIIPPTENQLKKYFEILLPKINNNNRLKEYFLKYKFEEELFNISKTITNSRNELNDKIRKLIEQKKKEKTISFELLVFKFNLSKLSWLKERYIPLLHCKGQIQNEIESLLYTDKFQNEELKRIINYILLLEKGKQFITEFIEYSEKKQLNNNLFKIKENFQSYQSQLEYIKKQLLLKNETLIWDTIKGVNVWDVVLEIEKDHYSNKLKNIAPKLSSLLKEIHQFNLEEYIPSLSQSYLPHNKIFFGPPGSGKTHGLTNAVEMRIENGLPAIIIDASSVRHSNWKEIFIGSFGLSSSWSETDIFKSLNNLAYSSPDNKILICIDGLDEVDNYSAWKIRIDELSGYLSKYPNIRFAISCRYYITSMNPLEIETVDNGSGNRSVILTDSSDAPKEKLFKIYLSEYDVDISEAPWVLNTIKSPLELRLFCQEYGGKKVSASAKTNIVNLVRSKIEKLEKEIDSEDGINWVLDDHVPSKILNILSDMFYMHDSPIIPRESVITKILESSVKDLVNRNSIVKVLDYLCRYDFLLKISSPTTNDLVPTNYNYRIPYQSILELIIANSAIKEIIEKDLKSIPKNLIHNQNIVELIAISLLADYDMMIGENELWINDFSDSKLNLLKVIALASAGFSTLEKHSSWIVDKFIESSELRYHLMNKIIIPGSKIPNFPIGALFVHKLLTKQKTVYARDIIWSGPPHPSKKPFRLGSLILPYYKEGWEIMSDSFVLKGDEKHDGYPLILAWSLTFIENVFREHCRKELCRWGFINPTEFLKLLEITYSTDDPQMKEDLACIASGVASLMKKSNINHLENLKKWAIDNIFKETELLKYRSPLIRQAGRIIVERAFLFNIAEQKEIDKCRPPFQLPFESLSLDTDALYSSGQDGYYPIENDLAWYVIHDSFKPFLPSSLDWKNLPSHIEDFFSKHRQKTGINVRANYGFALSAAIAYIKNMGYDKENGYTWTQATHGSKSKIATFEEKYTWCAVHHIMGYFSDYLLHAINSFGNQFDYVTDYSSLLKIPNPAQLVKPVTSDKINSTWIIPNELSPKTNFSDNNIVSDIEQWVHNEELPEIFDWLILDNTQTSEVYPESKNNWTVLYNYTSLSDPDSIVDTAISSSACFIKEEYFQDFLSIVNDHWPFHKKFPTDIHSYPNSSTYISPINLCWMYWLDDVEPSVEFSQNDDFQFEVFYGVSKVIDNTIEESDVHYKIPSKFTRNLVEIVDGNGKVFLDKNDEIIAFSNNIGKAYYDVQEMLLINEDCLNSKLITSGLKKVWFVSIFRDVTLDKRKELDFYTRHMRVWLVWEERNGFSKKLLIDDDYKPKKNVKQDKSYENPFLLKILKQINEEEE